MDHERANHFGNTSEPIYWYDIEDGIIYIPVQTPTIPPLEQVD
jgi:hypothetical protein